MSYLHLSKRNRPFECPPVFLYCARAIISSKTNIYPCNPTFYLKWIEGCVYYMAVFT